MNLHCLWTQHPASRSGTWHQWNSALHRREKTEGLFSEKREGCIFFLTNKSAGKLHTYRMPPAVSRFPIIEPMSVFVLSCGPCCFGVCPKKLDFVIAGFSTGLILGFHKVESLVIRVFCLDNSGGTPNMVPFIKNADVWINVVKQCSYLGCVYPAW